MIGRIKLMVCDKGYFDLLSRDGEHTLSLCCHKPHWRHSTLTLLRKIELLLKTEQLLSIEQDGIGHTSEEERLKLLKSRVQEMHDGYLKKEANSSPLLNSYFGCEEEVVALNKSIQNYLAPPPLLPVPNELILHITHFLEVSDLAIFARINRTANALAKATLANRAKEFGAPHLPYPESAYYLKGLFRDVHHHSMCIPVRFHSKRGNKLKPEGTLRNLRSINLQEYLYLFSKDSVYFHCSHRFRDFFNTIPSLPPSRYLPLTDALAAIRNAIVHREASIVKKILQNGFTPNIPLSPLGYYPIHFAAQRGSVEIVEILLSHGASVNERVHDYVTPLHFACGYGDQWCYTASPKVVELLLRKGADPNILTRYGNSALHYAVKTRNLDIIALLLNHGANPNAKNDVDITPLNMPCIQAPNADGIPEVIPLLLKHGADPLLCNRERLSPAYRKLFNV